MLDLVPLLVVLLVTVVVGFSLGTGRFTRQLNPRPTSLLSTLTTDPTTHQPSLSLQPAPKPPPAPPAPSPSPPPHSTSTSPPPSEPQSPSSLLLSHATKPPSSPPTTRNLLVVAKHLPIKVTPPAPSSPSAEWVVEWDDSRSFLSNLRCLASPSVTIHWVGLAQTAFISPTVDPALTARYTALCAERNCHPVFLTPQLHDTYLNGFCKAILWPILHFVMPSPTDNFGESWPSVWSAYQEANEAVAAEVMRLMRGENDSVWVHNYHLFLVPSFIRRLHPYAKVGLFIHTPFPTSDIFRALPTRSLLLESIMSCDLLGFHTFDYARHFLSCSKRVLDLDFETLPGGALGIKYSGRFVSLLISHVGIASQVIRAVSKSERTQKRVQEIRDMFRGRRMLIGVEDLDAVKGPLLKVQAIDRFLSKYHDLVDKVVFVELLLLSKNYSDTLGIQRDIQSEIARVRTKFGPSVIHVIQPTEYLPLEELIAWYRASHVAVVSTFWDGLNLMPYEYTASQDMADPGALIISEFMGCSRSLNGVLRVNPWSLEGVADAIQQALTMTLQQRIADHARRSHYVMGHTVERWANGFLDHLDRASALGAQLHFVVQGVGSSSRLVGLRSDFHHLEEERLLRSYRRCQKRIILLDYDGTLIASEQKKGPTKVHSSAPPASVLRLLHRLCEDENNCVFLMSGRTRATLMEWFGPLTELGLAAEKGLFLRWPKRLEKSCRMTWGESSKMREEEEEEDAEDGKSTAQPPFVRSQSLQVSGSRDSSPSLSSTAAVRSALDDAWEHMVSLHDVSWKAAALDIIRSYTEQTDGSWIEDKEFAIMWHYEQADVEYGKMQATDLHKYLTKLLANPSVDVVKYEHSSILEVKPHGVSKGNAATAICEALLCDREKERLLLYGERQNSFHRAITAPVVSLQSEKPLPPPPFRQAGVDASEGVMFLAIGDDRSDEDMFVAVQAQQWKEAKARVTRLAEQAGLRRGTTATAVSAEEKEQARTRRLTTAAVSSPKSASPQPDPLTAEGEDDSDVFTVCVGMKPSAAHYYLEDDQQVVKVLHTVAADRSSHHREPEAGASVEGVRRRRKRNVSSRSIGDRMGPQEFLS